MDPSPSSYTIRLGIIFASWLAEICTKWRIEGGAPTQPISGETPSDASAIGGSD
uniref:Uncharacterized protein n=1 Tax=Amphimedon queenslandica TaxID=400682 RepID=A0A1X7V6U3_AMPQE